MSIIMFIKVIIASLLFVGFVEEPKTERQVILPSHVNPFQTEFSNITPNPTVFQVIYDSEELPESIPVEEPTNTMFPNPVMSVAAEWSDLIYAKLSEKYDEISKPLLSVAADWFSEKYNEMSKSALSVAAEYSDLIYAEYNEMSKSAVSVAAEYSDLIHAEYNEMLKSALSVAAEYSDLISEKLSEKYNEMSKSALSVAAEYSDLIHAEYNEMSKSAVSVAAEYSDLIHAKYNEMSKSALSVAIDWSHLIAVKSREFSESTLVREPLLPAADLSDLIYAKFWKPIPSIAADCSHLIAVKSRVFSESTLVREPTTTMYWNALLPLVIAMLLTGVCKTCNPQLEKKSSNDEEVVIVETETLKDDEVDIVKTETSTNDEVTLAETETSNEEEAVIVETETSNDDEVTLAETETTNEEEAIIVETVTSNDDEVTLAETETTNDEERADEEKKDQPKESHETFDYDSNALYGEPDPNLLYKTETSDEKDTTVETESSNDEVISNDEAITGDDENTDDFDILDQSKFDEALRKFGYEHARDLTQIGLRQRRRELADMDDLEDYYERLMAETKDIWDPDARDDANEKEQADEEKKEQPTESHETFDYDSNALYGEPEAASIPDAIEDLAPSKPKLTMEQINDQVFKTPSYLKYLDTRKPAQALPEAVSKACSLEEVERQMAAATKSMKSNRFPAKLKNHRVDCSKRSGEFSCDEIENPSKKQKTDCLLAETKDIKKEEKKLDTMVKTTLSRKNKAEKSAPKKKASSAKYKTKDKHNKCRSCR